MKQVVLILLLTCITSSVAQESKEMFSLTTVSDKQIDIKGTAKGMLVSPYEGKIVFLEFWGEKCGPCLLSIPHYVHLQDKYKDDLRVIALEVYGASNTHLKEYADNPSKNINLEYISHFLKKKSKIKGAKAFLQPAIDELKKFKESGKKLNYDIVSRQEAESFMKYVMKRATWQGQIPFLLILDKNGEVIKMLSGLVKEKELEEIIQKEITRK